MSGIINSPRHGSHPDCRAPLIQIDAPHSITMETDFCLQALHEAFAKHGQPEIFNTDQGSQFTSLDFTSTLADRGIKISMDGRGSWRDNVFVERLWRSIKVSAVSRPSCPTSAS